MMGVMDIVLVAAVVFAGSMIGGSIGAWIGFMIYKKGLKNEQQKNFKKCAPLR